MEEATRRRVMLTPTLLLALVVLAASVPAGFCAINPQDGSALNDLKSQWTNASLSWSSASDPCDGGWDGVICSNGRVTSLRLSSVNIQGTLSDSVGQLTQLVYLDVSFNLGLNGGMPATIGNLAQLTTLILAGCSFTGSIPQELGNLQQLTFLALNSNKFTGAIPASLGLLSNLFWLDLADNQLTGPIPISTATTPGLDQLSHTNHFHFNKNKLSGTLTGLFNSNMSLIHVLFDSNQFTGPIPAELGGVSTLQILRLDRNGLQGAVPPNISNLVNLNELNLASNQLTGSLPDLSSMTKLNVVDLSNNSFAVSVAPNWFTTLTSLTSVSISSGQLSGGVPKGLFRLPQLQQVVLSNNAFNGTLEISGNISNQIQAINLMNNGIVAANITPSYTKALVLLGNPGCVDPDLKAFCSLKQENMIAYNTSLSKCSSIASCSTDQSLNPANCGCAYPYAGKMIFRAPFFTDLTNSATFQQLETSLTTQLSLRDGSVFLSDIHFNSDNYLQIQVAFFPSTGVSFSVPDLIKIGFDLSNQTYNPPANFGPYYFIADPYALLAGSNHTAWNRKLLALLALLLLVVAYCCNRNRKLQLVVACCCNWNRNVQTATSVRGQEDDREMRSPNSLLYDLSTLRAATTNFSQENKLGEGGFGPVYKGTLQDGQEIAVKRLSATSQQGRVEMNNEVFILTKLQHRNLVRLLGYCIEEHERLLVYEFVTNNSLDKILFDPARHHELGCWGPRHKIIEGISRGLLYLHKDSRENIIHRDLKASNILLDANMNPKISDFGLAKLFNMDSSVRSASRLAGTPGYIAPEYVQDGTCTTKSDIFSYGVLVLEIVTGRPKTYTLASGHSENLLTYVWRHWSRGSMQTLLEGCPYEGRRPQEMRRCIHVGLLCVQKDPEHRPSMESVNAMLNIRSSTVPEPAAPAYVVPGHETTVGSTARQGLMDVTSSMGQSINDADISYLEPR